MIPEGFISSLLERADIVDVVGRYVTLKKSGRNFMACCPFHKEKTPSFSVSPSKQIYKCFGCGKAGNAIGFLRDIERLEFPDAVRRLAEIYGMTVPEDRSPEKAEARAKAKTLGDFMKEAADYYTLMLRGTPRAADYLRQREITGETAARFGLGFSPEGWHALQAIFPGEKYLAKELLEVGLVLEKNGSRYDAFRGRIMFPIRSTRGTVIGFGARTMKGDEQPKYLNSPETPIYHKGSELYGLYEGRNAIIERGRAIVCEGYMDVIQLSQAGFEESVAALGTSITPEHVKKLFKLTDSVYFSFDGDSAGRKAARRALEAALPVIQDGQAAHFVLLPPEHDPDSLIKAEGPQAYEREIGRSLPLTDFLRSILTEGKSLSYAEERVKLAAEAKPLVLAMKHAPVLRLAVMRDVARLARLQLEDLEREWGVGAPERMPMPPAPSSFVPGTAGRGRAGQPGYGFRRDGWQRRAPIEPRIKVKDVRERMLQCFLAYPQLLDEFSDEISENFVNSGSDASQRIVDVWRAAGGEDGPITSPAALMPILEKMPESDRFSGLLSEELTIDTPLDAARIELRRAFIDIEREQVKARLLELSQKPVTDEMLAEIRKLETRRLKAERIAAEAAEEEKNWRRSAELAARTASFAAAEKGNADMVISSNPKVRELQEHLFGKDAMAEAAKKSAAIAAAAGRAPQLVAGADPWGAPPAGVQRRTANPFSNPFARAPSAAEAFPGLGTARPKAVQAVQGAADAAPEAPQRTRREEIADALRQQAERRAGTEPPAGFMDMPDDASLAGWADGIEEGDDEPYEPDLS